MNFITAPFPITKAPISIACTSAGHAMALMTFAKSLKLQTSYHPAGGKTHLRVVDVSHTLWVMGTDEAIRELENYNNQVLLPNQKAYEDAAHAES